MDHNPTKSFKMSILRPWVGTILPESTREENTPYVGYREEGSTCDPRSELPMGGREGGRE